MCVGPDGLSGSQWEALICQKCRRGLLCLKKLAQFREQRQAFINQTCLQHTEVLLECKLTSKSPPLVQCQQVKAVSSHLLIFTAVILNANTVFLISATHKAIVCAQYFLKALWLMCIFCPHQLPLQCCLVSSSNKSLLKPLEKLLPVCQRQTCRNW